MRGLRLTAQQKISSHNIGIRHHASDQKYIATASDSEKPAEHKILQNKKDSIITRYLKILVTLKLSVEVPPIHPPVPLSINYTRNLAILLRIWAGKMVLKRDSNIQGFTN